MRILIADDDPISRRLLESTLRKLGHEVVAVSDGTEAIAALLQPDAPRLAILDWMMPGADGLAVCRAVRQQSETYIYVVLLTARDRREDMVMALDAEADDFLTKPFDSVELRVRLRSGERVLTLQENLLETQRALRHQATHDHLTGIWNRRRVLEELDREVHRAEHERRPCSIAVADLDHFKHINDTFGHGSGDAVLVGVGAQLQSVLRAYDAVGRYGGEEFLLLLPGCDEATAVAVAERARHAVASHPVATTSGQIGVTLSVGVASTSACGYRRDALIDTADAALYRAKSCGRNCVFAAMGGLQPRVA
jgi:diguanylate cyclase (GGDEF)-like protein